MFISNPQLPEIPHLGGPQSEAFSMARLPPLRVNALEAHTSALNTVFSLYFSVYMLLVSLENDSVKRVSSHQA